MTRTVSDGQRTAIAIANLTAAVDGLNTIVYDDVGKPDLPKSGDYPLDLHINALTAHINFALAQYAALQSTVSQRIIDDRNEEIDEYEAEDVERRLAAMRSTFFGGGPAKSAADLFAAMFGERPAAPAETPEGDAKVEAAEPARDPAQTAVEGQPATAADDYDNRGFKHN